MSYQGKQRCLSHIPALFFPDCLTEVTACNLFNGLEVPLVISHKEAFDGYLDTVIGEFSWCEHITTRVIYRIFSSNGAKVNFFTSLKMSCATGIPDCSEEDLSMARSLNLSWNTALKEDDNGIQTLINSAEVSTLYDWHNYSIINMGFSTLFYCLSVVLGPHQAAGIWLYNPKGQRTESWRPPYQP